MDINRYIQFWNKTNKMPLYSYSIGDYFVSRRYRAAYKLLEQKGKIIPEQIDVEEFKSDYIRLYEEWKNRNTETVFTGTPFTGIPWMEAILGCDVYSTGFSFVAVTEYFDINSIGNELKINKEWLNKYIEFTVMLNELGRNRFPAGQPIMRGPVDIAGVLLKQEKFIYWFYDNPGKMVKLLNCCADAFLYVINEQKKHIEVFEGGYSMGFYDLWCPDQCIWYQDDLTALLSPSIYEEYVLNIHKRISASYEYSMIHLHPTSFFILDYLLDIKELKAIQINKDVGVSVHIIIDLLIKVNKSKNLVLWGDFNKQDLGEIINNLSPEGLYIYYYAEE